MKETNYVIRNTNSKNILMICIALILLLCIHRTSSNTSATPMDTSRNTLLKLTDQD